MLTSPLLLPTCQITCTELFSTAVGMPLLWKIWQSPIVTLTYIRSA